MHFNRSTASGRHVKRYRPERSWATIQHRYESGLRSLKEEGPRGSKRVQVDLCVRNTC